MKELRDIKIDMLTGSQNPAIDLFCQITDGTEIINCNVYETHGLEFIYHKDGEWIFYQDCKNKNFWCSHTKYWSHFESSLQLEYGEIQAITKYLVEEALKREVVTPISLRFHPMTMVEEALKREVVTPKLCTSLPRTSLPRPLVEEALKREAITSPQWHKNLPQVVEESLKREVVRAQVGPQSVYAGGILEEALKREVSTPQAVSKFANLYLSSTQVEETLKRELAPDNENPAEP